MKRSLSALLLTLVMLVGFNIAPAFAGGDQIHDSVAYPMVNAASDGYMVESKTADWLTSYGKYFGYDQGTDGCALSVIASGSITYVGCQPTDMDIVWSTKAPMTPLFIPVCDNSGRILSATILAHETISYRSRRITYWCHHHKHHKTIKVKIVTHDAKFMAPVPSTVPPRG
jgi:hypothetical protein